MSTLMSQPRTTRFTPEELLRLPDAKRYELIAGQLVERPVSVESSRIGLQIATLLNVEAKRTGEAAVYGSDLGYQCFPDDPAKVRRPDASVVRRERLASLTADRGFMPIPADLVVEVVSPNDLSYDVREKVETYLAAGFGTVWVVYPNRRIVDVHRPDGPTVTLHEGDEIAAAPALTGFRCRVGEFFAP